MKVAKNDRCSAKPVFRFVMTAVAFTLMLLGQTAAIAQTKNVKAAAKCSGAWTGSVTYMREQSNSNEKTVERVSQRGQDHIRSNMTYSYTAKVAVIESPEQNGTSVGRASISHTMSANESVEAVEKNSCDRGKSWREMRGSSTSKTETSASEGGVEANVNVGMNTDGTYSVSVGVPSIKGKVSGSTTSTFSGQCTPKEGKSLSTPATEIGIDGHSLTSDGTTRVNPNDPNKISGSYSLSLPGNVRETITWNLQRCGAPLRITDLKFEDMRFPKWNDWHEITEQVGTIDGNLVKIKATVLNASGETKYADVKFKETYKGDKWDGAKPDAPLNDETVSVRVDPGEEKEVEIVWDSSGYAWFDDGRPRLIQRIKAELEENGKKTDEMTKNLKVAPKPLILVHGLWSNWKAWETWQNILTTSHSYDWKAFPVGEHPDKGVMNTGGEFLSSEQTNSIFENAQQVGRYIKYAQEDRNAWHVDIVAHSMGGLISRQYIHAFMPPVEDGRPQVAHLIMLGTPNMGSPCADVMDLAFSVGGTVPEAIRQLRPSVVTEFNRVVTARKGVKFSVLAGNPMPVMCKSVVWNDGVVPVPSAKWIIRDNAESSSIHTDLTGTADFSSFVKPRLAVGPKGDHNPAAPETGGASAAAGPIRAERVYGMSMTPDMGDPSGPYDDPLSIGRSLTIAANQTTEIDIPVTAPTADIGVTFMANPSVKVTLIDANGTVAGKDLGDMRSSLVWFRSIYFNKAVSPGMWKLRLENKADLDQKAYLTVWFNAR